MLKKLYNNILILISVLLLSLTLLAHSPKLVFGDMIAVDNFEHFGIMFNGTSNITFGWEFGINEQITVTQLGLYDPGGDSFVVSHDIGLWEDDVGQALLSSVTVSAGMSGILIDEFRYVPIAPIELTAGNTYVLGVQGFLPRMIL